MKTGRMVNESLVYCEQLLHGAAWVTKRVRAEESGKVGRQRRTWHTAREEQDLVHLDHVFSVEHNSQVGPTHNEWRFLVNN
ncbi:unnamed protein product [Sphenostylis stenocarpa]|uniref:Uncharacterized protein n=1 Tax=Sphenostylis stenocarpa TaxID=92480 RepID=A0AA86V8S7_9FABA|nr:unnamed protein product [Sphenostylis stenocarpa]